MFFVSDHLLVAAADMPRSKVKLHGCKVLVAGTKLQVYVNERKSTVFYVDTGAEVMLEGGDVIVDTAGTRLGTGPAAALAFAQASTPKTPRAQTSPAKPDGRWDRLPTALPDCFAYNTGRYLQLYRDCTGRVIFRCHGKVLTLRKGSRVESGDYERLGVGPEAALKHKPPAGLHPVVPNRFVLWRTDDGGVRTRQLYASRGKAFYRLAGEEYDVDDGDVIVDWFNRELGRGPDCDKLQQTLDAMAEGRVLDDWQPAEGDAAHEGIHTPEPGAETALVVMHGYASEGDVSDSDSEDEGRHAATRVSQAGTCDESKADPAEGSTTPSLAALDNVQGAPNAGGSSEATSGDGKCKGRACKKAIVTTDESHPCRKKANHSYKFCHQHGCAKVLVCGCPCTYKKAKRAKKYCKLHMKAGKAAPRKRKRAAATAEPVSGQDAAAARPPTRVRTEGPAVAQASADQCSEGRAGAAAPESDVVPVPTFVQQVVGLARAWFGSQ